MILNIYGKKNIEVTKENDIWVIYELSDGKRVQSNDIVIPTDYSETQVITFISDLLHEAATPEFPEIIRVR